jgi:hypothetical protein
MAYKVELMKPITGLHSKGWHLALFNIYGLVQAENYHKCTSLLYCTIINLSKRLKLLAQGSSTIKCFTVVINISAF